MYQFRPLKLIKEKGSAWHYLSVFMYKVGGTLEILVILLLWLLIFSNTSILKGFTREEIITYIIAGNLISLLSSYFLHHIIAHDIIKDDSKLLVYYPIQYFFHILARGLGKNFFPFIIAAIFNILLLYFLVDSIVINVNILYLGLILLMVILAFVIEFLIAYLLKLYVFWTIESSQLYTVLMRIKRFLAGNYFPLSLLPHIFLTTSLTLPFAYSFFVPMELYLKKIDLETGLKGIGVQVIWIVIMYAFIKITWQKKIKKSRIKQGKQIAGIDLTKEKLNTD